VPTLHLVPAIRLQLSKHLQPNSSDTEPIGLLKDHLASFVNTKLHVGPLHNLAALLDPRLKGNYTLMSPADRQKSIADLRDMVASVPGSFDSGE